MQFILFLIVLIAGCYSLRKPKCRLLALEGGGTKGAFQSGVFKALVELLDAEEVKYNAVAGVSVGSVNGVYLAATQIGREKEASRKLSRLWKTIKFEDVVQEFSFLDVVRGFFDRESFLSNAPFPKYITKVLKREGNKLYRRFTIGIVDAHTAKTVIVNGTVGMEVLPKYIVASAAIPGIFPYSVLNNRILIDGGTIDNINLRGGIAQCRDLVEDDSAITVDVILTNPLSRYRAMDMRDEASYNVYLRGNELGEKARNYWYLKDAVTAFPRVNWRYLVAPKEELPNYPILPLSFDRETLRVQEEIGYNVTKELILTEEAGNFRRVLGESTRVRRRRIGKSENAD